MAYPPPRRGRRGRDPSCRRALNRAAFEFGALTRLLAERLGERRLQVEALLQIVSVFVRPGGFVDKGRVRDCIAAGIARAWVHVGTPRGFQLGKTLRAFMSLPLTIDQWVMIVCMSRAMSGPGI